MLWLKFITAVTVDITTSYTVLVITHQNLIADFPSIQNAYKNWIISGQNPLKKKKAPLEWKLQEPVHFIAVSH